LALADRIQLIFRHWVLGDYTYVDQPKQYILGKMT
jgi:hypothetical protein